MRFLLTMKDNGKTPDEQLMIEMGRFIGELSRSGVLLATGGLDPVGTKITAADGKVTVTDGPFTEAKEAIVSFALVEVGSKEEAIELSRRFFGVLGDGEATMQQVFG